MMIMIIIIRAASFLPGSAMDLYLQVHGLSCVPVLCVYSEG